MVLAAPEQKGNSMKPAEFNRTTPLDALRTRFRGDLISADDPSYDELRTLFNAYNDFRPALIARCEGTADVVAAVKYARAENLEIAVKSRGRHMAGFASVDGGLVIDLEPMRSVKVDAAEQTAWIQTGANGADVTAETLAYGLGAVVGAASTTGVGGVNLHGGIGWMSAKLGWGSDTILEAEVVLADGSIVRAAPEEHPDLYWAIRGEAANFGVVTWIKQKLAPIGPLYAGTLMYDGEQAEDFLKFFRDFNVTASPDFGVMLDFMAAPHEEWIPEHLRGKMIIVLTLAHVGSAEQAQKDFQPLLDAFEPLVNTLVEVDLLEFMLAQDVDYPAIRQWFDEEQVTTLTDDVIAAEVAAARKLAERGLTGYLITYPFRGLVAGEPEIPGSFPRRTPGGWSIGTMAAWEDKTGDDAHIAWSDETMDALRATGDVTGNVYGNVLQVPDIERHRAAHGEKNWARLTQVKKQYDPENVFHRNHNIPPAP
jgi:FAD/FMN-containing dehydrogenase